MNAVPAPAEAKVSAPGFAFASAISSFTVATPSEGCTTSTEGPVAITITARKSRSGSNGSFA